MRTDVVQDVDGGLTRVPALQLRRQHVARGPYRRGVTNPSQHVMGRDGRGQL